jgi:inhibitor of cysteine peptidase
MKKVSLILILLLAGVFICSALSPVIVLEKQNGRTFDLAVGEYIDIALTGNPTTGYNWQLTNNIAPELKKIFGPEFKPNGEKLGSSGKLIFRFKAVKAGSKEIKLSYLRSWEKGVKPVKTFRIYVNIQ